MNIEKPEAVIEVIESALEERKVKTDRRKELDEDSPYTDPKNDRRSGKDRRDD